MESNEIGAAIRYYRKLSGLTQQDLAKLAGIGKTALFDIEKGKESVQLNTLLNVLAVLNIKLRIEPPFKSRDEND